MVCPPTFIATRQHCGGVCREELGGPWVAFFLSRLRNSLYWRENLIKRTSGSELVERNDYGSALSKSRSTTASLVIANTSLGPSQSSD